MPRCLKITKKFLITWSLQSNRSLLKRQKLVGNVKMSKFKCDILSNFPTMSGYSTSIRNSIGIAVQLFCIQAVGLNTDHCISLFSPLFTKKGFDLTAKPFFRPPFLATSFTDCKTFFLQMRNGMMRYYCLHYCIATAAATIQSCILVRREAFYCALQQPRAAFARPRRLLSPENSGLRKKTREGDTLSCIFPRIKCIQYRQPRNVFEKFKVLWERVSRFEIRWSETAWKIRDFKLVFRTFTSGK